MRAIWWFLCFPLIEFVITLLLLGDLVWTTLYQSTFLIIIISLHPRHDWMTNCLIGGSHLLPCKEVGVVRACRPCNASRPPGCMCRFCTMLCLFEHNEAQNAGPAMHPGHNCEFAKCLTIEQWSKSTLPYRWTIIKDQQDCGGLQVLQCIQATSVFVHNV